MLAFSLPTTLLCIPTTIQPHNLPKYRTFNTLIIVSCLLYICTAICGGIALGLPQLQTITSDKSYTVNGGDEVIVHSTYQHGIFQSCMQKSYTVFCGDSGNSSSYSISECTATLFSCDLNFHQYIFQNAIIPPTSLEYTYTVPQCSGFVISQVFAFYGPFYGLLCIFIASVMFYRITHPQLPTEEISSCRKKPTFYRSKVRLFFLGGLSLIFLLVTCILTQVNDGIDYNVDDFRNADIDTSVGISSMLLAACLVLSLAALFMTVLATLAVRDCPPSYTLQNTTVTTPFLSWNAQSDIGPATPYYPYTVPLQHAAPAPYTMAMPYH